jgi:hypothetical protein
MEPLPRDLAALVELAHRAELDGTNQFVGKVEGGFHGSKLAGLPVCCQRQALK